MSFLPARVLNKTCKNSTRVFNKLSSYSLVPYTTNWITCELNTTRGNSVKLALISHLHIPVFTFCYRSSMSERASTSCLYDFRV